LKQSLSIGLIKYPWEPSGKILESSLVILFKAIIKKEKFQQN
jgi:hypothetical protein